MALKVRILLFSKKIGWNLQYTVKFIYSEKATKYCKISTLLLSYVVPVKSKVGILQNFVAFSEYMNFKNRDYWSFLLLLKVTLILQFSLILGLDVPMADSVLIQTYAPVQMAILEPDARQVLIFLCTIPNTMGLKNHSGFLLIIFNRKKNLETFCEIVELYT